MTLGALVERGYDVEHSAQSCALGGLVGNCPQKSLEKRHAATYVKVKRKISRSNRSLSAILDILQKSRLRLLCANAPLHFHKTR